MEVPAWRDTSERDDDVTIRWREREGKGAEQQQSEEWRGAAAAVRRTSEESGALRAPFIPSLIPSFCVCVCFWGIVAVPLWDCIALPGIGHPHPHHVWKIGGAAGAGAHHRRPPPSPLQRTIATLCCHSHLSRSCFSVAMPLRWGFMSR